MSVLALCLLAGLSCAVWLGHTLRPASANFQMIRVTPDKLLVGTIGVPYQNELRASGGGSSVYTFALDNEVRDCLPAGLRLENGTPDDVAGLRGTPQESGLFSFTVKVSSPPAFATRQHFTVFIRARADCGTLGLVEDVPCNPRLTLGVPYSETFNVVGVGTPPYRFDVELRVGERMPKGMELTPGPRPDQVTLSGTPEETGNFTFHIRVEDANGCYGVICHDYPIRNKAECLLGLFPENLDGVQSIEGEPLALSFSPNGGSAPYTFSLDNRPGERVPQGLFLGSNANAEGALLSGTPQEAGTFCFTLRAKDKNDCEVTNSYTLTVRSKSSTSPPTVCPVVSLEPALLANARLQLGASFAQTFTAKGGAAPYTFTAEQLPPGILAGAQNSQGGQIALSGAPTQAGSWEFRVSATDMNGCVGKRTYILNVPCLDGPVISFLPRTLPGGIVGNAYPAQTIIQQPANRTCSLSVSSGALPPGLLLVGNVLQGTPAQAGGFTFTLTAQSNGCSGAREYTLLIGGPLVCPPNLTQTLAAGANEAVVNYPMPTAPPGNTVSCTPSSGSTFVLGTTTVNCSVADAANNTASCSFTVLVGSCTLIDKCPTPITVNASQGACNAVVNYPVPATSGGCPVTCGPSAGSTFAVGTTTVTCTARDAGVVTGTCSFTVTVNDTQAPTLVCPPNITQAAAPDICAAVVTYSSPTASDNCVGVGTPVCTPASGSMFAVGPTTVTCTVRDAAQNQTTCSFTVTVTDTQAPVITCPPNLSVAGTAPTVVNYDLPTVRDNCPGVRAPVCTPASGAAFVVGTTTVTCTVADAAGNTANCSFRVTVGACPLAVTGAPLNFGGPLTAGLTPNAQAASQVLTLNNTNCGTVSFGLALQRTDSNPRLTDKNDGRAILSAANGQRSLDPASRRPFYVRLVGAETLVNLCDPAQTAQASGACDSFTLAAGASLNLRVFFDPLVPARASGTGNNLTAAQVLPLILESQLILKPPASSPLQNNQPLSTLAAQLAPQLRFVHTCDPSRDPAQNPMVTVVRASNEFVVTTGVYDPGRTLQSARFDFLEGSTATVPVQTIEVSTELVNTITNSQLHRGQSFSFIQRFSNASAYLEVTHVRVTLNGNAALTAGLGETGCPPSSPSFQTAPPEDPARLTLPDVELAPPTRAPRPPSNNSRRRR